jgi:hypothetical protein
MLAFDRRGGIRCHRRLIATILLALIAGPGHALIGGTPDDRGDYAAVVVLAAGPRSVCSATKIGPRRFLTAAHCVVDAVSATLRPAFEAGGQVRVSNALVPRDGGDFVVVEVVGTRLPPDYLDGLARFQAYRRERREVLAEVLSGAELERRMLMLSMRHHFSARFPDLAIVDVATATPAIPSLSVDLTPLHRDDAVTLVGYGCEHSPSASDQTDADDDPPFGRRLAGRTRVIRADRVNVYTYARLMADGAPSLCPGDSGGAVLRDGQVVGVLGTVYGLTRRDAANSNMSVNLHSLRGWSVWEDGG